MMVTRHHGNIDSLVAFDSNPAIVIVVVRVVVGILASCGVWACDSYTNTRRECGKIDRRNAGRVQGLNGDGQDD